MTACPTCGCPSRSGRERSYCSRRCIQRDPVHSARDARTRRERYAKDQEHRERERERERERNRERYASDPIYRERQLERSRKYRRAFRERVNATDRARRRAPNQVARKLKRARERYASDAAYRERKREQVRELMRAARSKRKRALLALVIGNPRLTELITKWEMINGS